MTSMRRRLFLFTVASAVAAALTVAGCADSDGDGYSSLEDCDDEDADRNFSAQERCNGLDDDCDGQVPDAEADLDGDGHLACGDDCDDADFYTHGGDPASEDPAAQPAVELCDDVDNDCDGEVDEDFADDNEDGRVDCLEVDADGDGVLPWQGDCDDENPDTYEGAEEICDGLDNDCDGFPDMDIGGEADRDADGSLSCEDCDDLDGINFPGNPEVCDGQDNDCDGRIDNGVLPTWYQDEDGDGYGRDDVSVQSCLNIDGYSQLNGDCADDDPFRSPGLAEVCDQIDNDCDQFVDQGVLLEWYVDADLDGYGNRDQIVWDCTQPEGYSSFDTDCDAADPAVYPGADEICDRKDSNCDGFIPAEEIDGDGDDVTICENDCDDANPLIYDAAPEACSGIDENCDGTPDNGLFTDMCPPPTNVAVTTCINGTPSECALVDCDAGFFDIDTQYGTGCECGDDSAGLGCGQAFSVGTLQNGNVLFRTGKLPEPQLVDWVHAHFPDNGRGPGNGAPVIKFTASGNPGNNYRFDVFRNCSGNAFNCGTGSSTGNTQWSYEDNQSSGTNRYNSNGNSWPSNIYVRVFRINGGNNCDDYTLEFGR